MIVKATTAKKCREALYDAYEKQRPIILDIAKGVDPAEVPIVVSECDECLGKKLIVYLGTDPVRNTCGRCKSLLHHTNVVQMVVQGKRVIYREEEF